jgi:hypothetical protein
MQFLHHLFSRSFSRLSAANPVVGAEVGAVIWNIIPRYPKNLPDYVSNDKLETSQNI